MVNAIVVIAFAAVLAGKWSFYSKYASKKQSAK